MSYTKQTWQTGDVITAEKLNHMEDGITSAQVYTESEQVRFSGSVATEERNGMYGALIDCDLSDEPQQIAVTFDGTEYTCEKIVFSDAAMYGSGDPGFSEYPFIISAGNLSFIQTEAGGTHQVEITAIAKAVNEDLADVIPVMRLVNGITNSADALSAFNAGKLLYFTYQNGFYIVTGTDTTNNKFILTPADGAGSCSFSGTKITIDPK